MYEKESNELLNKFNVKWEELKNKSSDLSYLLNRLQSSGKVAVFGGAPRDWFLNYNPKDIDLVVELRHGNLNDELKFLPKEIVKVNGFGSAKFTLDGITFDVWELKNTHNFVDSGYDVAFENLPKIVPYNLQSLIVLLSGNKTEVIQEHFFLGVEKQVVEVVSDKNIMNKVFVANKALYFEKKYGFSLSQTVKDFCSKLLAKEAKEKEEFDLEDSGPLMSSNSPEARKIRKDKEKSDKKQSLVDCSWSFVDTLDKTNNILISSNDQSSNS